MHFTTASLLALTTTALAAGTASVVNHCPTQVFLTITRSTQQSTTFALAANSGTYTEPITGQGNSFGLTKSDQYFSPATPKLIWGFSDAPPLLYYTVSNVDGNPFDGQSFNVSSSDASCGSVTAYDGATHVCGDANNYTLTLC